MSKVYTIICRHCGEPFRTEIPSTWYCPKAECQERKGNYHLPETPPPELDRKLGVIANIMREYGITYSEYSRNRVLYLKLYEM
jgi:hypothetical protein